MHFKKINTLCGWLVFLTASVVYLKTLEPSVSFWDCGEFISCAYHLEIGHQPGAPFFLLLGRLFSIIAGNHSHMVAKMINSLSAFASGFTMMFLYWTITRMTAKLITETVDSRIIRSIIIIASGLAGALVCTFSDTFWFSAVEGEVYATSALFTAVAFWAILKWEEVADSDTSDRWILLILFLIGLSIGVHLLNVLTLPAIGLVYYFKKYQVSNKGFLIAIIFSFALLYSLVFFLIPLLIRLAAWFDLLFVNGFGLSYNSGSLFYILLLAAAFVFLLGYSHKRKKVILNKIILGFMVFCIGYSSYIILAIRAEANPPINLSRVGDPFSLLGYITREQYVSRPLVYGPYYNAPVTGYKSGHTYIPWEGKYKRTEKNGRYEYDKRFMTLFPRMSSDDPQDIAAYKKWADIKGRPVQVLNREGKQEILMKPLFSENLRYFFKYQLGYMYWRYFMWNFAGRQTENQGNGNILNGNWISGVSWIDELRLGPQENYPDTLLANKGRNVYYLLPLLLGLFGLIYQFNRSKRDFSVVLMFFIMTGIAIVVYLNEIPVTPRERDYAMGGSFYVYCIWIGMGVASLAGYVKKKVPAVISLGLVICLCVIYIPGLMAKENFDDHNRSGRYVARDFAYDYLNSCAPNAILFTNADNDTYPLWYAQEVEGIRTDVRVILAPFLSADWYIDQMSDWHELASPVPTTIGIKKYASGKINSVPFYKRTDQYANLKDVIEFIKSDDPRAMVKVSDDSGINYYPTSLFRLPVNGDVVTSPGSLSSVDFEVKKKYLLKNEVVILDILATNNWKRPVYFLSTQVPRSLGLDDYLQLDGFAYRLVPWKTQPTDGFSETGRVDADSLYDKLMNRFRWGNMNDPKIFMDYNTVRTTNILGIRSCFSRLADEYTKQGNREKAIRVLDRCMELMPHQSVPYDIFMLPLIQAYSNTGDTLKANQISAEYKAILEKELKYYNSLGDHWKKGVEYEKRYAEYVLQELDR
jgi:hypothetical protein